ncbi:MAG: S-layer homology domain-containing protein, partial [Eubacteriales bacterium]|nr:S-layer homology domain-containing protein [Eubacteriales bacterium]
VAISNPSDQTVQVVQQAAGDKNLTLVVPAVNFDITCTYNGRTVDVSKFNAYVERRIAIPAGVDPNKITTGIVVNPDGTTRHVPTRITVVDGVYYAVINSLTNSTYSVVWHPYKFNDAANHWAEDAINNMGSRMVVSGVGEGIYEPDRNMIRAEFAAIIVKALGLKPGEGTKSFSDVRSSDWYDGYVKTAAEYGIITGYSSGNFGPKDAITREQAMTMIARAMDITGLNTQFTSTERDQLLAGFGDETKTVDYARNSIAACIKTGVVSGRNGNLIAPKENITRAEVAVIVERLLQKSDLI